MLIDTHAHLHFDSYSDDLRTVLSNARINNVTKIITVGTDLESSRVALELVERADTKADATGVQLFATIGLHPHETASDIEPLLDLAKRNKTKIVAIGECGLDYFKNHASRDEQKKALIAQLELAIELNLPLIFHVRDSWGDFFDVLSNYQDVRGVIHSFTAGPSEVEKANRLGLYFGLNGIMTFTRQPSQLEAAKLIPADRLLLETDCPFLSPTPLRGKRNEPANLTIIAKFLAQLRSEGFASLAESTSANAHNLFKL